MQRLQRLLSEWAGLCRRVSLTNYIGYIGNIGIYKNYKYGDSDNRHSSTHLTKQNFSKTLISHVAHALEREMADSLSCLSKGSYVAYALERDMARLLPSPSWSGLCQCRGPNARVFRESPRTRARDLPLRDGTNADSQIDATNSTIYYYVEISTLWHLPACRTRSEGIPVLPLGQTGRNHRLTGNREWAGAVQNQPEAFDALTCYIRVIQAEYSEFQPQFLGESHDLSLVSATQYGTHAPPHRFSCSQSAGIAIGAVNHPVHNHVLEKTPLFPRINRRPFLFLFPFFIIFFFGYGHWIRKA